MLIDRQRFVLLARDGDDLIRKPPRGNCRRGLLLAPQRPRVHLFTADAKAAGGLLRRQTHTNSGDGAGQPLHHAIDHLSIKQLVPPAHLRHIEGHVAHALGPAGEIHVALTQQYPLPRHVHRLHPRGAGDVDGGPGHALRQPRPQRRLPSDVHPGPSLNDLPHENLRHGLTSNAVALDEGLQDKSSETGSGVLQQPSAKAADRGADCIDDESEGHEGLLRVGVLPAPQARSIIATSGSWWTTKLTPPAACACATDPLASCWCGRCPGYLGTGDCDRGGIGAARGNQCDSARRGFPCG